MDGLWCDGGVIGKNPSKLGGTWAWLLVRGGHVVRRASGVVAPEDLGEPHVTNNHTECLAVLRAVEAMPADWKGVAYTDSQVTVFRFTVTAARQLPAFARDRVMAVRGREYPPRFVLVAGHPTDQELLAGRRVRNGLPTSKFNVECDRECSRLAKQFMEKL